MPFEAPERVEQHRLAIPVLKAAWVLVKRGWCRGAAAVDAEGRPVYRAGQTPVGFSLLGAVRAAAPVESPILSEYARRLLCKLTFEFDLSAWNDHPVRTKREVLALLVRAIRVASGKAQLGGWRVTSAPTPEPRRVEQLDLFTNEGAPHA